MIIVDNSTWRELLRNELSTTGTISDESINMSGLVNIKEVVAELLDEREESL